jgi:hypothetical protein
MKDEKKDVHPLPSIRELSNVSHTPWNKLTRKISPDFLLLIALIHVILTRLPKSTQQLNRKYIIQVRNRFITLILLILTLLVCLSVIYHCQGVE